MYIFGGINQGQKRFNDVNEFDFETQTWTRKIAIDQYEPTTRTFHQSVILGLPNQDSWLYVLGGFDGQKTNDMYRMKVQ